MTRARENADASRLKSPLASPTFTGNFTSVGIDDNADANAITIDSSEQVGIGVTPSTSLTVTGSQTKSTIEMPSGGTNGMFSVLSYDADNVGLFFDAHYNSGWKSKDAGSSFGIYKQGGDKLKFVYDTAAVDGAITWNDAMMIASDGKVGVACSDPVGSFDVRGGSGLSVSGGTSNGTYRRAYFWAPNGGVYFTSGTNEALLNSSGVWSDASDERIKKDIADIDYGLETVKKCQPRKYKMKESEVDQIGFVAQEILPHIPEVISGGEIDEETKEQKHYSLSYGSLVAVAFKAIQELSAKNDALETRIEALESA